MHATIILTHNQKCSYFMTSEGFILQTKMSLNNVEMNKGAEHVEEMGGEIYGKGVAFLVPVLSRLLRLPLWYRSESEG